MRVRIRQFIALAQLAAVEAIRQPVVLLVGLSGLAFCAVLPFVVTHVLNEGERIIRDSALALHITSGLLLGVLAASGTFRDEVRRGTASAVLSKPVDRSLFFVAKTAGICAVTLLYSALMAVGALLATRTVAPAFGFDLWGSFPLLAAIVLAAAAGGMQNYLTQRPFASAAFGWLLLFVALAFTVSALIGEEGRRAATFGDALPMEILPAAVLLAMAILVQTVLAAALSTRLEAVPVFAICGSVLMLGLMSDYLFGGAAEGSRLAAAVYGILPNFQHYWASDALAHGPIPWSYVARVGLYSVCVLAGVGSAGILAFRTMELRG